MGAHAILEPVQGALFGKGGVHTLDGEMPRVRKAMFVALLMLHRIPARPRSGVLLDVG